MSVGELKTIDDGEEGFAAQVRSLRFRIAPEWDDAIADGGAR